MSDTCSECDSLSGKKLYSHLFSKHGYSKDEIERVKKEKRDQKVASRREDTYTCEECDSIFSTKAILATHKSTKHRHKPAGSSERRMKCPVCMQEVKTHEELVEHTQLEHACDADDYRVDSLFFTDKNQYEAWRKKEENDHVLQWAKTSVTKTGDRKTSYFRCSRAIPYPGYALTQGHKSKKDVLYCTAFLRVSEERRGIAVTYCNKHIGHAEDPALLSIDKESESYIVTLLNDGFTSNQILRKIRTDFRNKKIKTRLYFTTAKDIRNIAARNNVVPGRKHAFDIQSVEMRVNEASEEDGIRRYIPAIDETGDGFLLVVITPVQKSWITRYGRRGISIDDTFNLTRYSLRLATVIVADEWDMGLPAAYLLSYRMTEEEVFRLFSEIKEVAPDFNPKLFMTDDTNSFYNGFQRAFPHAATVKLLCCFHVLQAIKRNCKAKLIEKKHTGMVMSKVRSLCRSADRSDFTTKYSTLLTHLQELGEHQFCSYMEDTWSHRVQQWGGFARENAVMNTSMLGERFHKRLKHELPDSKPNMRLDRLLETIISLAAELEEDRTIRMRRGLLDGRYRLLQQHHQHEEAVKWYRERQEDVKVVGSGLWKVTEGGAVHKVQQVDCTCDSTLNNHCTKGDCGACGYGFHCDCEKDVQSGISCLHVHASLMYAPSGVVDRLMEVKSNTVLTLQGKIATGTSSQAEIEGNFESAETMAPPASSRAQVHPSDTDILDANKSILHEIEAEYSVIRSNALKISKIADDEVYQSLEKVRQSLRSIRFEIEDTVRSKCTQKKTRQTEIVRRAEVPISGGPSRDPPIRKFQPRSSQKKKQDTREEPPPLPSYQPDDLNFCAVCFRRDPRNPSSEESTTWLKCNSCKRWAHEDCTSGEGSRCPLDGGAFYYSLVEDQP